MDIPGSNSMDDSAISQLYILRRLKFLIIGYIFSLACHVTWCSRIYLFFSSVKFSGVAIKASVSRSLEAAAFALWLWWVFLLCDPRSLWSSPRCLEQSRMKWPSWPQLKHFGIFPCCLGGLCVLADGAEDWLDLVDDRNPFIFVSSWVSACCTKFRVMSSALASRAVTIVE